MSYIIREGNLASTPELRQSDKGPYTFAQVIVNDRSQDEDGNWSDTGSLLYNVTVSGDKARRLVETAQSSGNIRVVFAGRYRVSEYDRKDSQGKGTSHEVRADVLGIALTGQNVTVTRGTE